MYHDANYYVMKCVKCQLNNPIPHQPPEELSLILSPIPFAIWGINIFGHLAKAKGQLVYTAVTIGYMTKWVEANLLRISVSTFIIFQEVSSVPVWHSNDELFDNGL